MADTIDVSWGTREGASTESASQEKEEKKETEGGVRHAVRLADPQRRALRNYVVFFSKSDQGSPPRNLPLGHCVPYSAALHSSTRPIAPL